MIFTQEQTIQIAGAIEAVRETIFYENLGKIPTMSYREAQKSYGYGKITRWLENGLIKPIRHGEEKNSSFRIKVSELLMAEQSERLSIRITNEKS